MNFVTRAWLNVKAKKGRSILQVLVLAAILMFVLAGIIIKQGATTAANNAKKSAGATVTLSGNRQTAFKKMNKSSSKNAKLNVASVSVSTAKKIAKSKYVKSYNISTSTTATAKSFSAISTSGANSQGQAGPGGKKTSSSSTGNLTISGVSATSTLSTFTGGTAKIVKGRGINASDAGTNNVVIEKQLAKKNSISVGDTITIKSGSTKYKLKVVGIYSSSSTSSVGGMASSDPSNTLYTSYTFANKLKGSKYAGTADSVTYTLSDPSKSSQFTKYAKSLISTSKYSLTVDKSTYESMLTPLNNVKNIASKIVWLVAIAGTIILALIIILMIRERRYEIGVLLSLGEKRSKVIAQFFVELFMVMLVALVIAGVGGKYLGNAMGKQLLSQSTTTTTTTTSSTPSNGAPGGGGGHQQGGAPSGGGAMNSSQQSKQTTASIDTTVSVTSLIKLGGFGLAIIFLSIMIGSLGILRLQPKKILID